MGFFDSIKQGFENGKAVFGEPNYRALIIGDNQAYFENVKYIKSYSPDKIEIDLKNGGLEIKGCCLTVKKYCCGDLAVCGKILEIKRV